MKISRLILRRQQNKFDPLFMKIKVDKITKQITITSVFFCFFLKIVACTLVTIMFVSDNPPPPNKEFKWLLTCLPILWVHSRLEYCHVTALIVHIEQPRRHSMVELDCRTSAQLNIL